MDHIVHGSLLFIIHLVFVGIAVRDIGQSLPFFNKIGFQNTPIPSVIQNSGGCKIQLLHATAASNVGFNILMDSNEIKFPGHTHASFLVPSVSAVEKYLTGEPTPLAISGYRKMGERNAAVFVRLYFKNLSFCISYIKL